LQTRASERFLVLGKVLKPHGIHGWLRILSFASSPEVFVRAGKVWLSLEDRIGPHDVMDAKSFKGVVLLKLKGIGDRNEAERFRGWEILVDASQIPKEEDEYFWFELKGLAIVDEKGQVLGEVVDLLETKAHTLLVAKGSAKEFYVPMVDEIVKEISLQGGYVRIKAIEGLLELNEV